MRRKGSRYENSKAFSQDKGFAGFRARQLSTATGIVEYTVLQNDRLDTLANNYYQNDQRWWRIMDANNSFLYGFELTNDDMQGDVLIIPASKESIK